MSAAQRTVDTLESSATSVQSNTKDLTHRSSSVPRTCRKPCSCRPSTCAASSPPCRRR
jgi:hypothetical protein